MDYGTKFDNYFVLYNFTYHTKLNASNISGIWSLFGFGVCSEDIVERKVCVNIRFESFSSITRTGQNTVMFL